MNDENTMLPGRQVAIEGLNIDKIKGNIVNGGSACW